MEQAEDSQKQSAPIGDPVKDGSVDSPQQLQMERSLSEDIREEREDLKEAAEHTTNVILDLNLDGTIKWVSPSWTQIIGTESEALIGQPVADILIENKDVFANAVEALQKDDSRSIIVRFSTHVGKSSILSPRSSTSEVPQDEDGQDKVEAEEEPTHTIKLEAQGIMVYDRTSGTASHVGFFKSFRV